MNKRIKKKKGHFRCPFCRKHMQYVYNQHDKRTKYFCWDAFEIDIRDGKPGLYLARTHEPEKTKII